jgi:predicted ATPase
VAHILEEELLERESEVALLGELIESAAGGAGAVVFVEGPAGIGKSGLLREAQALARAAGLTTASARGSELERDFAFGLVRQLFEPLVNTIAPKQRTRLFAGAARLARPLFEALDTAS